MKHGGDIYSNKVNMDFSVNVNPLGIPDEISSALENALSECSAYPDINYTLLYERLSAFFGVEKDKLILGNGASELFAATVNALKPERVLIPVPSFYGYEYASESAEVLFYQMSEEDSFSLDIHFLDELTRDVDMLFLCNPNNPTGVLYDGKLLSGILRRAKANDITVVLDESFSFFCGREISLVSRMEEFENLIIVKSLTKIFSIPGVRLGAALSADAKKVKKIRRALPEWNLSVFAQRAGEACAGLGGFVDRTVSYLKTEREFLCDELAKRGIKVIGAGANFIFFYSEEPLYDRLLSGGILIRDCSDMRGLKEGYYRIAVRSRRENEELLYRLMKILD